MESKVDDKRALYFIAVVPPDEIAAEVTMLKQYMAKKFASSRALRSPAHITLVAPFFLGQKHEKNLGEALAKSVGKFPAFSLELNGFEAFKPKVIYVASDESPELRKLQEKIFNDLYLLLHELREGKQVKKMSFNPHMTIAYRDLTKEIFLAAWPEFENRPFHASFTVDHVCLLKHNRQTWDILKRIPLQTH